ncbi:MAG: hypothetical protein AAF587_22545 [Bacteroidota bacterium]
MNRTCPAKMINPSIEYTYARFGVKRGKSPLPKNSKKEAFPLAYHPA